MTKRVLATCENCGKELFEHDFGDGIWTSGPDVYEINGYKTCDKCFDVVASLPPKGDEDVH